MARAGMPDAGAQPIDGLARAVHDLHGPLTVIRGMCATLLRDEVAGDRRRALRLIDTEAVGLASGLRDLTRIAADDSVPAARCDLAAVVAAAATRFAPLAAADGRRILVRGRRDATPVAGDAHRIARALDNLVWNALRHGAERGTVTLGLRVRDDAAEARVRDDGPGVPVIDRERVFLPGERGSAPRGTGQGLGLAIARDIVESYGGRLTLDPVGRGACFRLVLPLRAGAAGDPRAA